MYFRQVEPPARAAATARRSAIEKLQCRILLVEDNAAVAQATRSLLESIGCGTTRVATADDAWDYLNAHPKDVDVVLSDIEMPGGMDGIGLATLVKARDPELPIILMTGYAERLEQAVKQNLEVLPKPFSVETLAEAIGRAATNRSAPERPMQRVGNSASSS